VTRIRFGTEDIQYITLFENLTGAKVKDCVQEENSIGFLVPKGDMGLAIGKKGSNIERIRNVLGKSVWIIEYSDNQSNFIKSLFQPIKINRVQINETKDDKIATINISKLDRGKVIGHLGERIKIAKKLAKRHYNISDINIRTT